MFLLKSLLMLPFFGLLLDGEGAGAAAGDEGKGQAEGGEAGASESSEGAASSAEGSEGQGASGKDDKTASEGKEGHDQGEDEDKELEEAIKSGDSIPYKRFKKWNEKTQELRKKHDEASKELEGIQEFIRQNPDVLRTILEKQGVKGEALKKAMSDAGYDDAADKSAEGKEQSEEELFNSFAKGLDLTKQGSWGIVMGRMARHYADNAVKPIASKMTAKEAEGRISQMESEAKKLAKDTYGLEYGVAGKDEGNSNTAVGKIYNYLIKNPEDAGLGHSKLLRLALSEEGYKLGEQKGREAELDRQKRLKASQGEGDGQRGREDTPNKNWSVERLLEYSRAHNK